MNEHKSPRTTAQIMADLLQCIVETEWEDSVYDRADDWYKGCNDCGAFASDDKETHKPDCPRHALIEEALAFLRVEKSLVRSEEEDFIIPERK